jgi:hypothetical protein
MAASDYVPMLVKNRLHLAGRPQMGSHPNPRGYNTPHGEQPRSGVSKDVAAVSHPHHLTAP